jgi:hypothetical protein
MSNEDDMKTKRARTSKHDMYTLECLPFALTSDLVRSPVIGETSICKFVPCPCGCRNLKLALLTDPSASEETGMPTGLYMGGLSRPIEGWRAFQAELGPALDAAEAMFRQTDN